jgi:hypothetical protein
MMPEDPKPRSKTVSTSHALTAQGLRLTNMFRMLEDVDDREEVIALAERLLNAQTAKSK